MRQEKPSEYEFDKAMEFAKSPAGQQLLAMLQKGGDAEIEKVRQLVKTGDFSQAQEIISKMLSSSEASELVNNIRGDE